MASQTQGIQQLLAAEKRAAEKVYFRKEASNGLGAFFCYVIYQFVIYPLNRSVRHESERIVV